jgi:carbon-monoxide dehydrogenase large subunit
MGMGTYGSRSGAVGMSAIVKALDKVEIKAKKIAAHLLEADESDIVIENGELKVAGTDKSVPWFQMALAAYTAHNLPEGMEPGLKEGAFYDPSNFTFPAGTYVCEVEVDPETGKTEIVQFCCGRRLRQDHQSDDRRRPGPWWHGAGDRPGAAGKCTHYDEETGQLLTASYMDYTMPRADDLPSFQISTHGNRLPVQPARHQGLR